ncbi:MAG TPA: pyridoxal phosphate-dependent aminotransferase [Polyangiaceae bacterium]|nr:pyridoxal phosphate-dependent aminotransferase [Polyangiaceae bacterium]
MPPFRYMVWAKAHRAGARFHLGLSGMAPPPPDLMPLALSEPDLAQRGTDAPPDAHARLAARFAVDRSELLLTLGTSHAFYLVCASTLSPGDVCFVERPAYEMLPTLPTLFGASVMPFERTLADGYRPAADLPARIRAERPKMVLLSNPHNPSGAFLSLDELTPLARATQEVGAVLAVDEVYLEYFPDAPARSARHLGEHVVVASSFTKAFGLGTVRFGWLIGSRARIEAAARYNDYISVLYPNPCAWVGLLALDHLEALQERAMRVASENRAIVRTFVEARDDVRWHPPEAGIIAFPQLVDLDDTSAFCDELLERHDTLLVPGSFFDAPSHVRLAYGIDPSLLREGLARLGRALDAR